MRTKLFRRQNNWAIAQPAFTMLNKNREETIRDGMELGLCIYNNKTKNLLSPERDCLWYFCDNVQYIVQGSKRSIGDENHGKVEFEETELNLNGTENFIFSAMAIVINWEEQKKKTILEGQIPWNTFHYKTRHLFSRSFS